MGDSKRDASQSSRETHIPPPLDPFPTYQTPYPRHPSDAHENPFIQFRRYADAQISSLIAGVSRTLSASGSVNVRESERSDHISELVQSLDDLRVEAQRSMRQVYQSIRDKTEDDRRKIEENDAERDLITLGLEHCPVFRQSNTSPGNEDGHHTELDMYERLEQQGSPPTQLKPPMLSGLISGLGWDGRKRVNDYLRGTGHDYPRVTGRDFVSSHKEEAEHNEWSERLDPSGSEYEALQWLVNSDYSPLTLESTHDSPCSFEKNVAGHLDWKEAFDDLLLVSDHDDPWVENLDAARPIACLLTNILGELRVGFGGLMSDEDNTNSRIFNRTLGIAVPPLISAVENRLPGDWQALWDAQQPMCLEPSLIADEVDQRDGIVDSQDLAPETIMSVLNAAHRQEETSIEQEHALTPLNELATPSGMPSKLSTSNMTQSSHDHQIGNLVSTMTRIETRTLPDGSTETRRVLRKRFSDGREENNESVEVQHPYVGHKSASIQAPKPVQHTNETPQVEKSSRRVGSGWFWN